MADLGNLWFSLGLDDSKFEKEWTAAVKKYSKQQKLVLDVEITQKTINALQQLRALGGDSKQWKAVKEAAKASAELAMAQAKVNTEMERTKLLQERINNVRNRGNAVGSQRAMAKEYKIQSMWLTNLSTMASNYLSLFAAQQVISNIARITGEFELQRKTLQAMVGDFQGSDIYGKMQKLAVVSPFQFKDLTSYSKQLAAFSIQYEDLYDTTKMLADVSAGLGVDMSRIVLAYGQIKNAEVLKGTELRQLTEAGVPILEELAKALSEARGEAVSIGEVFTQISQKMISFDMVKDVFEKLTSEGGKFYNMQEIQAETLAGKLSNLTDAYQIMMNKIGESQEDNLKGAVDFLYGLMDNYRELVSVLKVATYTWGSYQAAMLLAASYQKITSDNFKKLANVLISVVRGLDATKAAYQALDLAQKATLWGVLLSVITAVGTALYQAYNNSKAFNDELNKMISADVSKLEKEKKLLDDIKKSIDGAAQGSQNRRDAISKLNNVFGKYLDDMLTETATANQLADAYDRITVAMQNKYQQESLQKAMDKVEEEFGGKISEELTDLSNKLVEWGIDKDLADDIATKFRQAIEETPDIKYPDALKKISDRFGKDIADNVETALLPGPTDFGIGIDLYFKELKSAVNKYTEAVDGANNAHKRLFKTDDFDTQAEQAAVQALTEKYEKLKEAILGAENTEPKQVASNLESLEIKRLQELEELYGNPENKDIFNPEKSQKYHNQWEALLGTTEEWAKRIKDFIGENKTLFEFKPNKNELLTDYIDRLNERYKDLLESKKKLTGVKGGEKELGIINDKLEGIKKVAGVNGIKLIDPNTKNVANTLQRYNELYNKFFADLKIKASELENQLSAINIGDIGADKVTAELNQINREFSENVVKIDKYKNTLIKSWTEVMQAQAKKDGKTFSGVATLDDLPEEARRAIASWENVIAAKRKYDEALLDRSILDQYRDIESRKLEIRKKYEAEFERMYDATTGEFAEGFDVEQWIQSLRQALEGVDKEFDPIYKKIFGNIQSMSRSQIASYIKKLKEDISSGNLSEEGLDAAINQVQQLQEAYEKLGEVDITTNLDEFIKRSRNLKNMRSIIATIKDSEKKAQLTENADLEEQNLRLSKGAIAAKGFGDTLSFAGQKMRELAQATGDAELEETAKQFENLGNVVSSIAQGAAQGGWIGALVAGLTSIAGILADNIIEAAAYNKQLANSLRDYQREVLKLRLTLNEEDYDTIFGVNAMQKALDASQKAKEALDLYREALSKKAKEPLASDLFVSDFKTPLEDFSPENEGKISFEFSGKDGLSPYNTAALDAYKRGLSEIEGMIIRTKNYNWAQEVFGKEDEYATLKDFKPELWDENGILDIEQVKIFLETSKDILDDTQERILQNIIDLNEKYEENMKILNEYITDIFSDTASNIATRMIDAFAKTGDAAFEMGDLVNEIARDMGQSLIESLLLDQYLTPAMDKIKSIYDSSSDNYISNDAQRTQQAIMAMQEGIAAAQAAVPEVNKLLQALQATGVQLGENAEETTDTLSGLTEEQQNLFLSYVNAIRADVSMNKVALSAITLNTTTISNNIASALIVWKEIEANTHRSADGVDKLIEVIDSVIGAYDGGGGQAFRVNIA